MPATAGRVRMPANNRVHSSAALQTHGIWQSAIGYDPYAPVSSKKESKPDNDPENAYASFKGLLALARITSGGSSSDETRGACRKCGRIGHLTYQCRNFLSLKEDEKEGDDSALRAANAVFEKIKKAKEETESEGDGDESSSSSSDSSVDPEIERIIAERFGKPMSKKAGSLKKRSNSSGDDDEERKHKHERGRHPHRRKKRRDSDADESGSDRNRKRRRRGKRRMSGSESSSDESDGHRGRRSSRRRKERRSVLSSDSESTASSSDEDERGKRREKRRRRRRGHKREQRY